MQYFYLKDENGNDTEDMGVKRINTDSTTSYIPNDVKNRDWQLYLAWKAEDPENNVPQSES